MANNHFFRFMPLVNVLFINNTFARGMKRNKSFLAITRTFFGLHSVTLYIFNLLVKSFNLMYERARSGTCPVNPGPGNIGQPRPRQNPSPGLTLVKESFEF